jgi:hypothetical protein
MIMRIPAQVRLHREKILREIGLMLARSDSAAPGSDKADSCGALVAQPGSGQPHSGESSSMLAGAAHSESAQTAAAQADPANHKD